MHVNAMYGLAGAVCAGGWNRYEICDMRLVMISKGGITIERVSPKTHPITQDSSPANPRPDL
jgi:hypothetical protein